MIRPPPDFCLAVEFDTVKFSTKVHDTVYSYSRRQDSLRLLRLGKQVKSTTSLPQNIRLAEYPPKNSIGQLNGRNKFGWGFSGYNSATKFEDGLATHSSVIHAWVL